MYHLADVVYRAAPRSLPFNLSISRTGMELHWKMPIITVSPDEEFLILLPFLLLLLSPALMLSCSHPASILTPVPGTELRPAHTETEEFLLFLLIQCSHLTQTHSTALTLLSPSVSAQPQTWPGSWLCGLWSLSTRLSPWMKNSVHCPKEIFPCI